MELAVNTKVMCIAWKDPVLLATHERNRVGKTGIIKDILPRPLVYYVKIDAGSYAWLWPDQIEVISSCNSQVNKV